MTQQTLEILGDEWIEPSLVESEYPELIASEDSLTLEDSLDSEDSLASVDSTALEDSLASEDSLDSEDSLASGNRIFSQEIEVDSLTGMPNDPTVNTRVTALKNARLQIDLFGRRQSLARVTATIKVELDTLAILLNSNFLLQSSVWGIDGGIFSNGNDHLFNFSNQIITGEGTYAFSRVVPRSVLNEDRSWFNNCDEIAASFNLVSYDSFFPVNKKAMTPILTGYF
ncbi:hypothetical protein [Microcoleus sp. OTE_8_concoct_300]|uniref:hypothetical protein n=1 Tax=Microcoleus sp. OTE_8_concoct_300 TaxID=2964710 RepID=UPI00403F7A70